MTLVLKPSPLRYPKETRDPVYIQTIIPTVLFCPGCGHQHIDKQEVDIDWTVRKHRTHLCHYCGVLFRPYNRYYTCGVEIGETVPGFLDGRYAVYTEGSKWTSRFGRPFSFVGKVDGYHFALKGKLVLGRLLFLTGPVIVLSQPKTYNGLVESIHALSDQLGEMSRSRPTNTGNVCGTPRQQLEEQFRQSGVMHLYDTLRQGVGIDWQEEKDDYTAESKEDTHEEKG